MFTENKIIRLEAKLRDERRTLRGYQKMYDQYVGFGVLRKPVGRFGTASLISASKNRIAKLQAEINRLKKQ